MMTIYITNRILKEPSLRVVKDRFGEVLHPFLQALWGFEFIICDDFLDRLQHEILVAKPKDGGGCSEGLDGIVNPGELAALAGSVCIESEA